MSDLLQDTPRIGRPPIGPRWQTKVPPEVNAELLAFMRRRKLRRAQALRFIIQLGLEASRTQGRKP